MKTESVGGNSGRVEVKGVISVSRVGGQKKRQKRYAEADMKNMQLWWADGCKSSLGVGWWRFS